MFFDLGSKQSRPNNKNCKVYCIQNFYALRSNQMRSNSIGGNSVRSIRPIAITDQSLHILLYYYLLYVYITS